MGPTGAGKSVQAQLLAADRGWVHLSTGRLLRADPVASLNLTDGELVPDEVVERVLETAVRALPPAQSIVLDGFPRTVGEAIWLEDRLVAWGRTLRRTVLIAVDQATSQARLSSRGRSDDSLEAQVAKWQAYETATRPVITYYKQRHELTEVDGSGTVEDVTGRVKELLT
jgi:adenylate kinase